MTITLVTPGGRRETAERCVAPRLTSLADARMGLLSNGKANADVLLEETAALFTANFGCTVSHFIDKRNASRPAEPAHHQALAAEADFLLTAVGD